MVIPGKRSPAVCIRSNDADGLQLRLIQWKDAIIFQQNEALLRGSSCESQMFCRFYFCIWNLIKFTAVNQSQQIPRRKQPDCRLCDCLLSNQSILYRT